MKRSSSVVVGMDIAMDFVNECFDKVLSYIYKVLQPT